MSMDIDINYRGISADNLKNIKYTITIRIQSMKYNQMRPAFNKTYSV